MFTTANGASVGQETVNFTFDTVTGLLTATIATSPAGRTGTLFTVAVNQVTGEYVLTLAKPVLHAQGPNDENDATLVLGYTVTDSDNTPANGSLTITFDDDAPTATAESGSVAEGAAAIAGQLDFVPGADGASVTHIGATLLTFDAGTGWSAWFDIGDGQVRVKANGAYEFLPDASGTTGSASTTFTITDGDGDTVPLAFNFSVTDANEPSALNVTAAVDDDGLSGGNPASTTGDLNANYGADGVQGTADDDLDGASSEASFRGNLGFSYGGDGPAGPATDFVFTTANGASVGQETVNFTFDTVTGLLTATIATSPAGRTGTLFTVAVNQVTGEYVLTLAKPVLHAQGPNDENDATLVLGYTVTDSDNTPANGSLTITFDDDAPTATAESGSVAEGAAAIAGQLDFVPGADGASVTHIGATLLTFDAGTGWSAWFDIGDGQVRVKANGAYEFLPDASGTTGSASTTFTITDGDGDTVPLAFNFSVTDANEPSALNVTAAVDDDGLSGGNPASTTGDLNANYGADGVQGTADDDLDGASSEASFRGNLGFSYGGDGPAGPATDFVFTTANGASVGQETVNFTFDTVTGLLTATIATSPAGRTGTLFTVAVNQVTGEYVLTLAKPVLHAQGPNDENDATLVLGYTVTDSDNTPANGSLTITFDDDAPSAGLALTGNGSVTHDESAGLQGQDTTSAATIALFSGIVGGVDPHGSSPLGYAKGAAAVVSSATSGFGADGQATVNPVVYALQAASAGVELGADHDRGGEDLPLHLGQSGGRPAWLGGWRSDRRCERDDRVRGRDRRVGHAQHGAVPVAQSSAGRVLEPERSGLGRGRRDPGQGDGDRRRRRYEHGDGEPGCQHGDVRRRCAERGSGADRQRFGDA